MVSRAVDEVVRMGRIVIIMQRSIKIIGGVAVLD